MVKIAERLGTRLGGVGRNVRSFPWTLLVLTVLCGNAAPVAATPAPLERATTLDHYAFVVTFDPGQRTLEGSVDVTWTNPSPFEQRMLPFRLYPNATYYGDGELAILSARVDGVPASMQLSFDPTVMEVDLGDEVAPGESVTVGLDFVTVIPDAPDASFGILGGDEETGWRLADWYPVVAGWDDDGWYLAPPTALGDPTFPASATWEMKLAAPGAYTVVASGIETVIATDVDGMDVTRIVSGPGRDLTLTLVPVGGEVATANAGDVPVVVSGGSQAIASEVAATVTAGLPVLGAWLGDYPGSELDIVLTPLAGTPAVAWSGLIWVDPTRFPDDDDLERMRFTLVHELTHLWIPGIAGSNNNDHGFMSEGLANTLAVLVARDRYGPDAARIWLERYVAASYTRQVERGHDGIADTPLADGMDHGLRNALVYGKAALGFEAIRQQVGDDAFLAGLQGYMDTFRDRNSGPADLRLAWERASGQDLGDLWRFWFEEATATPDDVERVLAGFA